MRSVKISTLLFSGLACFISVGFWQNIWVSATISFLGIILIYLYLKTFKLDDRKIEDRITIRRNWVRILVTYIATGFIFIGGIGLIGLALYSSIDVEKAKDIYLSILPVATGIIAYWFGSR